MRVIAPITITDAMLIYSSVDEPDLGSPGVEPEWDSGTTYNTGDRASDITTHLVYESAVDSNLNHALTDTTKWTEIGPTNRWAMFDTLRNTQTTAPSSIEVTLKPGQRINAVALLGLEATSVRIEMSDAAGTPSTLYYEHDEDLNEREVLDWYDYFFDDFSTKPSLVLFDLPPYSGAYINVTILNTGGDAACGALVIGTYQYIGETQHEAESDAENFSTITRDEFGVATLVQRRSIPTVNARLLVDKDRINVVRALRTALNAVPAVWSGADDQDDDGYFEAVLILGIYRKFTINLMNPEEAEITLDLEEI